VAGFQTENENENEWENSGTQEREGDHARVSTLEVRIPLRMPTTQAI